MTCPNSPGPTMCRCLRGTPSSTSASSQPRITGFHAPNTGDVRSGVLRAGGVADASASRTVRRCTPCRSANDRILACSSRCSLRIRSYSSTLGSFTCPPGVILGRFTHRRARGSGVGPLQAITTAPTGAKSDCHSQRRLDCPDHGVLVEAVPFARPRVRFTRAFEDLVAWCASKTDKTAVTRLLRIAWPTVGAIVERVVADGLDPGRLDGLVDIGADEISWKRHHNYLTVVVDHATGDVIFTGEGKDTAALDAFFAELGPERSARLRAVSLDMGKAYPKSVAKDGHAPQAVICWDPFHVVKMGTEALNTVPIFTTWKGSQQITAWGACPSLATDLG